MKVYMCSSFGEFGGGRRIATLQERALWLYKILLGVLINNNVFSSSILEVFMADQGSEGLLSPYLREMRFGATRKYLKGRVLDVGCGAGGLASEVSGDKYLGVEVDSSSLQTAMENFPNHCFQNSLPESVEKFDTVISLAVIEHVKEPGTFLADLAKHLNLSETARIVITTPHPSMDWVHDVGSAIGLFSQHANEEHEDLLDRDKLELVGENAGLRLVEYRRFLFGANQIAVFSL
jgi:SAM-dependent methyltransferase